VINAPILDGGASAPGGPEPTYGCVSVRALRARARVCVFVCVFGDVELGESLLCVVCCVLCVSGYA